MRHASVIIGAAIIAVLTGCSSTHVARVGPNPVGLNSRAKDGQLQVFSALVGRTEGDNPTWYQHADYTICNAQGKTVLHVANEPGYYARSPQLVTLPPGNYIVKTEATDYPSVMVPVVIESGRVTKIHLDDSWKPTDASKSDVVRLPDDAPVGWSPDAH